MSSPVLNMINAEVRELIRLLDEYRRGNTHIDVLLKYVDTIENHLDMMIAQLAPERITDERFTAASKVIESITSKFSELRKHIVSGEHEKAKKLLSDIMSEVRRLYRILMLIKAGSPITFVLNLAPQYLREASVTGPDALTAAGPMAIQLYASLVRRGGFATVDQLARELNVTDETRDEFNRAVSTLVSLGYARVEVTPDNKIALRLVR